MKGATTRPEFTTESTEVTERTPTWVGFSSVRSVSSVVNSSPFQGGPTGQ
jgi:hypothetical protein